MAQRGALSRAVATRLDWPARAGLGSAAGLLPALLWRLPARGPIALPLLTLLLTAAGAGLAAAAAEVTLRLLPELRRRLRTRVRPALRRSTRIGVPALISVVALVLICWIALETWPGTAAALGASWTLRSIAAVLTAGVAAVLALAPELLGRTGAAHRRVLWVLAGVPAGFLTAALVVFLAGRPPGAGRSMVYGAITVLCLWAAVLLFLTKRITRFAAAHLTCAFAAALWLGLILWSRDASADQVTRTIGAVLHWLASLAVALACAIGASRSARARIDGLDHRPPPSPPPLAVRLRAPLELTAVAFPAFLLAADQMIGGIWEAPLFALMVWYSFGLRRRLAAARQPAASAAADILLALLLGAVLVLFTVWLCNLLDLAPSEITAVHGTAEDAKTLVDLPWWSWATCYGLLAAGYLTALLLPDRPVGRAALRALTGRRTGRVTPAVNAVHRTLTVTKIALVLIVFVGLTAPPAVGGLLAHQARIRYTVALREELQAEGETALYRSVIARFTPRPPRPTVLPELVLRIHESEQPATKQSQDGATPAELRLAHRMGLLAARAADPAAYLQIPESISHTPPPSQEPASDAVLSERAAGYAGPAPDAESLDARVSRAQSERQREKRQEELRDLAAESAATAVTSTLDSVGLGHGEALGIVREYLDGLAESPLRDRFLSWTDRAVRAADRRRPPAAESLVDPDPVGLRSAADAQLSDDLFAAHDLVGSDPAQKRAEKESPLAGAVALARQSEGVESGSHSCGGCVHIPEPGEGEHGGTGGGEGGGFHGE
jgi:hypothetical protein